MRDSQVINPKIIDRQELQKQLNRWRFMNMTVAFTNGCFDILHSGHIASLELASKEADFLIVGLNSDESVQRLKGAGRPVNEQSARALLLASLVMVDLVVIFEEDTPRELILEVKPDVLVKGGDYKLEDIVGAKEVIENGGKVVINPIVPGFSTSNILAKIHKL